MTVSNQTPMTARMHSGEPIHIDIGGNKLRVRIRGHGPVVVLESGGGRAGVSYLEDVERQVATFATVITYDRAWLGLSHPPPETPTGPRSGGPKAVSWSAFVVH